MKELWERVNSKSIPARGLYVQPDGISFHFPDPEGNQIMVLWPQGVYEDAMGKDWESINDKEIMQWVQENRKRMQKGGQL
ncbi:hypothetical protein D3C73_1308320 [compost metagenome]